jgi:hypothetical protein
MQRLVVAMVTLLGLAAGSVAAGYLLFFSASTDRLASMAPSSTAAYVSVYLQPSSGQQLNLAGLIGRLPGFADSASLDEKVDQIIATILGDSGIDYAADVKPWLGDQLAVAGWPSSEDAAEPTFAIIADVKDPAAAEESLPNLLAADGVTPTAEDYEGTEVHVVGLTAYAFVGESVVIGQSSAAVEALIDVANGAASLAGRSDFAGAMDRLPSDHLAAAFLDLAALGRGTGEGDLEGVTVASAALVAEPEGLRLSGYAPIDLDVAPDGAPAARSVLADWMPADALASVVIVDAAGILEASEPLLGSTETGGQALSLIDTVRAIAAFGLGVDLDEDVLPLLGGEAGIALTDLTGEVPGAQLFLRPDDPSSLAGQLDDLATRLADAGAERTTVEIDGTEVTVLNVPEIGEVSYAVVDEVAILALSPEEVADAAAARRDGSTLAQTDAYTEAFTVVGTHEGSEAFADIGALVDLGVTEVAGVTLDGDARDILTQLGALAITFPPRDDLIEFHAALTVTEPGAE